MTTQFLVAMAGMYIIILITFFAMRMLFHDPLKKHELRRWSMGITWIYVIFTIAAFSGWLDLTTVAAGFVGFIFAWLGKFGGDWWAKSKHPRWIQGDYWGDLSANVRDELEENLKR